MTAVEAFDHVQEIFPFDAYMAREKSFCLDVAQCVLSSLDTGSSILDIGSGPCDKTAVLQALGYRCSACDDMQDPWHRVEGNLDKIVSFADRSGICFRMMNDDSIPFGRVRFNMVMLNHVLEHIHDSPRELLMKAVEYLEDEGLLFVTVPNAVSIRKRIYVALGRTNLPPYQDYFWAPAPWRGHIREYTSGDLTLLCEYMGLERVFIGGRHHMTSRVNVPWPWLYKAGTSLFPGTRDSWLLIARKPKDWQAPAISISSEDSDSKNPQPSA